MVAVRSKTRNERFRSYALACWRESSARKPKNTARSAAARSALVGEKKKFALTTFHRIFFFQAEDGIRYYKVTGVQTCALPIYQKNCCGCRCSRSPRKA